ncbi:hypothetical protein [Tahibacter aquaticus]|uniref:hypothetical protein n=1 Tax=Tahibacter aquaticus TaxID=520092 RepID=UPI0010610BF3|nr:hypothetical protein [Tahibacter aquaticus]
MAQRRAAADARANQAIDILRLTADSRRHQAAIDVLQRILLRGRVMRFDTLAQILEPQPWVTDAQGYLMDHVLTAETAILEHVCEAALFEVLALPDALEKPWADVEQRKKWSELYAATLRALADRADDAMRAMREAAALRQALERPEQ